MNSLAWCLLVALTLFLTVALSAAEEDVKELKIEVTKSVDCTRKTKNGDTISMHYKGMLTDGTKFDSSYDRGDPLTFKLGTGRVIKGWDQGLTEMCIGEKRTLTIPHHLAYGERGFPPKIPAKATLVFETELVKIDGKDEL
ncbi:uncharacterized protein [Apostichopus japonicus]|uniref:uncharacterized protein n=1 Tax=Stichopus japonicus TaxID=307972 RepID=UPI003AB7915D